MEVITINVWYIGQTLDRWFHLVELNLWHFRVGLFDGLPRRGVEYGFEEHHDARHIIGTDAITILNFFG